MTKKSAQVININDDNNRKRGQAMSYNKEQNIHKLNKEALQVSKEIAVKFIETQRLSPSNFAEIFPSIHKVVLETIHEGEHQVKDIEKKS